MLAQKNSLGRQFTLRNFKFFAVLFYHPGPLTRALIYLFIIKMATENEIFFVIFTPNQVVLTVHKLTIITQYVSTFIFL